MKFNKKLTVLAVSSVLALSAYASNALADDEYYQQGDIIDQVEDMLEELDFDDSSYQVISLSANDAQINASINLIGNEITFDNAGTASATANSTATSAVEGANATVLSQASASSGNFFKTTAIGSLNSTEIDIDTAFLYDRDNSDNENVYDSYESGPVDGIGSTALGNVITGLGGFLVAQEFLDNEDPRVSVFQGAFNTGEINASVNITAGNDISGVTRGRSGGYWNGLADLAIADLTITTTAIGASNSGYINVLDSFTVDVKTTGNKDVTTDYNPI